MRIKQIFICIILLFTMILTGCSEEKISESNQYLVDKVLGISVDSSSWQVKILASSDAEIHVALNGSVHNTESKPTVTLEGGKLEILQEEKRNVQNQISLGKEGQINIYLPTSCKVPVDVKNNNGDMEICDVSMANFSLNNKSGSINFNNVNGDNLKVDSESGDVSVSGSTFKQIKISTSSGYETLKESIGDIILKSKSGEVNFLGAEPNTNIDVQTESGDANISYKDEPDDLTLNVTSQSNDISVKLSDINYTVETSESKQGIIGNGKYELNLNSDNGTIVIK